MAFRRFIQRRMKWERVVAAAAGGGPSYSGVEGHVSESASQNNITVPAFTLTTGRIVVAFMSWDNTGAATITGITGGGASGTGVSWTGKISKTVDTRHGQAFECYIGVVNTGGSSGIVANLSGSASDRAMSVVEVMGANATQFNATATSITAIGTAVTIAITTGVANCFVVGYSFNDSGPNTYSAVPSGMTQINNFNGTNWAATNYRTTNPGAGPTSIDWTLSSNNEVLAMAVAVAP